MDRECRTCKWSGFDIADGPYCAHAKVLEQHNWGLLLSSRTIEKFCPSPKLPLYENRVALK